MANQGSVLKSMLSRRRDRAISIVLGMKEKEADSYLPRDVSARLRKVVLDQFNELADFAIDVCNSLDTGDIVLNEDWLVKLDEIHDVVVSSNGR
jgi:hypothetical protein